MSTPRRASHVVLTLLAPIVSVSAQTATFRELPQLHGAQAAMHDPSRGRTWFAMPGTPARLFEWDGATLRLRPGDLDPLSQVAAMAYDPATGHVRALGFAPTGQLFYGEHDGCRWNWQAVAQYLGSNQDTPIAYDTARSRFVAYRFQTNTTSIVVEFDGTNWVTSYHPQVTWRNVPGWTYDPLRNRCVLYGGTDYQGTRGDTWLWNGQSFTPLTTNVGPGPRQGGTLAFSSTHGGLVLYGDATLTQLDTWLLTGSTWTRLPTTADAGPLAVPVMVDDGTGVCVLGRTNSLFASGSRLTGNQWTPQDAFVGFVPRTNAAIGFDRGNGELVAFGGTFDDLETMQVFDGRWHTRRPIPAPPRRSFGRLTWSAVDQALLLHGGYDPNGAACTDTWLWRGNGWIQRTPPNSPPPRNFAAWAGDPSGGVMLYGGYDGTVRADHWRWDGATWQQLAAVGAPGPVFDARGALDEARQRTVLLGRFANGAVQTWEWDGVIWTLVDASSHPAPATGYQTAFDPGLGRVVSYDGNLRSWNGTVWQPETWSGAAPTAQALVADTRRGGLLALGSSAPSVVTTLTHQPATAQRTGASCAIGAAPELLALGAPALADAGFALDLGTLAPGSPCVVWFGVGGPGAIGSCAIVTGPTLGIVFATTDAGGTARVPLPIPDDRSLLGLALLAQGAVFDPARSPIGILTFSAGLALAIGW